MSRPIENINVKGRFLGVFILVIVQYLIGFIHIFFGVFLLVGSYFPVASFSAAPLIYNSYTWVYGLLTVFFTYLFWKGKRSGWIGTAAISIFVIAVDILAIFDLFNVLGIPKIAGLGEIPYSLFILFYLSQNHVRLKYNI
jgi:hypothetical protein